jgi:7-cyano-7-deazaguanine synthase in queuosine biosynthesis
MTKKEVIHTAKSIDVPLALTYSCYRGEPQACGRCGACEVMECI